MSYHLIDQPNLLIRAFSIQMPKIPSDIVASFLPLELENYLKLMEGE